MKHGDPSILFHLLALAIVVLTSTVIPVLPLFAPLAFVPVTAKALWAVSHRYEKPLKVRQIGYRDVAQTVIFVIILALAYNLG